ncbi:MAG: hypothetical protein CMG74_03490 [Candidatus Marinimicrobia bacterium]|nr:hypothetical protein [Candidatus Neomarinimicrobiota bacterium]|tara:strand:+ start:606 stop:923 length:318 start_codon:yes stop_codon:yes gene_type:complete
MNIRHAKSNDLSGIMGIEKRVFADKSWIHDMIAEELELRPDINTWVLIDMGVTLGYLMFPYIDREMQFLNFVIDIPFSKRGYGSTLLIYFFNQVQLKTSILLGGE